MNNRGLLIQLHSIMKDRHTAESFHANRVILSQTLTPDRMARRLLRARGGGLGTEGAAMEQKHHTDVERPKTSR